MIQSQVATDTRWKHSMGNKVKIECTIGNKYTLILETGLRSPALVKTIFVAITSNDLLQTSVNTMTIVYMLTVHDKTWYRSRSHSDLKHQIKSMM